MIFILACRANASAPLRELSHPQVYHLSMNEKRRDRNTCNYTHSILLPKKAYFTRCFQMHTIGEKSFLNRYKKSVIKRIHTYKKALSRVPCFVDDSYQFYTYIEKIKRIHPGFIAGWSTSQPSPLSCHHSQHVSNTGQGPCNHAWGGGGRCNWGMEKNNEKVVCFDSALIRFQTLN